MKRFDLRGLEYDFLPRMVQLIQRELDEGENGIFMFEIGNFSGIQESADCIKEHNWTLMNSIKYNEVDWTLVVKKEQPQDLILEEKE